MEVIMDIMGIASVAQDMKTVQMQAEVGLRVMKMAMDTAEQEGAAFIEMLDAALTGVGQNLDVSV